MCDTTALPLTAPRLCVWPSPHETVRSRTALPFDVAAVTANVNAAGKPTLGGLVGGVITRFGALVTTTVTWPEAPPREEGGPGGGAPLLEELEFGGGVLDEEPPVAPTVAVTVAC